MKYKLIIRVNPNTILTRKFLSTIWYGLPFTLDSACTREKTPTEITILCDEGIIGADKYMDTMYNSFVAEQKKGLQGLEFELIKPTKETPPPNTPVENANKDFNQASKDAGLIE